jgi:lipid II:glycine glycyltransferase (peptidoglycan interpeptide bridge formation enzyme)
VISLVIHQKCYDERLKNNIEKTRDPYDVTERRKLDNDILSCYTNNLNQILNTAKVKVKLKNLKENLFEIPEMKFIQPYMKKMKDKKTVGNSIPSKVIPI